MIRRAMMPLFHRWSWTSYRVAKSQPTFSTADCLRGPCGAQNERGVKRCLSTVSDVTIASDGSRKHPPGVGVAYSAAEIEIARQAYYAGNSPEEIVDLVKSEQRPTPDIYRLLLQALGPRRKAPMSVVRKDRPKPRKWTTAEDDVVLIRSAERVAYRVIAKELNRSWTSIASRVFELNRMRAAGVVADYRLVGDWTSEDLRLLRTLAAEGKTLTEMGTDLGCNRDSIRTQIRRLRLSVKPVLDSWTEEQEELLQRLFHSGLKDKEIGRQLVPPRTQAAVIQKRSKLGLTFTRHRHKHEDWSEEDDDRIRELYGRGVPVREIAMRLNSSRTILAVKTRLQRLALTGEPTGPPWSASSDEQLRELFSVQGLSDERIGQKLSPPRRPSAVATRRSILGLRRKPPQGGRSSAKPWLPKDDDELIRLTTMGLSREDVSQQMRRSEISIQSRQQRLRAAQKGDRNDPQLVAEA